MQVGGEEKGKFRGLCPALMTNDCISKMAPLVGGGQTLCFYCGFQMVEDEIGPRKESSQSKFRKHCRQSWHDIL